MYYGIPITSEKKFDHYCGEIYTQMRAKDEDPEFKKLLSETLLKIEEGKDPDIYSIHQEYTKESFMALMNLSFRQYHLEMFLEQYPIHQQLILVLFHCYHLLHLDL